VQRLETVTIGRAAWAAIVCLQGSIRLSIKVPEPLRVIELTMDDGAIIRIRQHGNPAGPRLALSHGNGLAIEGYLPFWERLQERYELILFDFRNHGQNPLHNFTHHNWPQFIHDLERIFESVQQNLGAKRTAGVFHSLSAVTSVMQTQRMGRRWDPLVLFDPPFYPPDGHPIRELQRGNEDDIATRAERRTPNYPDPIDLAQQFQRRFPKWEPKAYELMARATLRYDASAQRWVLACPREYEAHIFRSNRETTTWRRLRQMPVAVKLICADPADGGPPALIGRALADEAMVEYEAIAGTSHFLQIERPQECVEAMEAFLVKQGFIL
jgi:pimeloyl-ACP methyl ester carboxylesterase